MNTGTVVSVGSSSSILPRNRTERMAPEIPIRNERNITRIMFISSIFVILFFYFLMKILYQKIKPYQYENSQHLLHQLGADNNQSQHHFHVKYMPQFPYQFHQQQTLLDQ